MADFIIKNYYKNLTNTKMIFEKIYQGLVHTLKAKRNKFYYIMF